MARGRDLSPPPVDLVVDADCDVRSILAAPETFGQYLGLPPATPDLADSIGVAFLDPPEHAAVRRQLARRWFTGSRIRALEPRIQAIARRRIEKIGEGTESFLQDFAEPIAMDVLAALFEIPAPVWRELHSPVTGVHEQRNGLLPGNDVAHRNFVEHVQAVGSMGPGDSSDRSANAAATTPEDVSLALFADVAGVQSTAILIATLLWHATRAQRGVGVLAPGGVDEALRLASPIRFVTRRVLRPASIGTSLLPIGATIRLDLGAANYDPMRFPDPTSFDPHRPNVRDHLALGLGIHSCLGGMLAKRQAAIVVNSILAAQPNVKLTEHGPDYRLVV